MKKELFALVYGLAALACAEHCSETPEEYGRRRGDVDRTADDMLTIQYYVDWAEDVGNEYMNLCYIVGERYKMEEGDDVQACVWWRKAANGLGNDCASGT